ncbi:hypothetical protein [Kitasatospora sp. KL5]|uniref:hypothetical protein n=1 Tax=Kitasatospora sp. KL5 TaxID=3425125 RepID=UPI003D6E0A80
MAGYSREKFPHWASQGNSCDTREKVLARDGVGVRADTGCRAAAGTWFSVYDNATITGSAKADADRLVPLANAWRSGAGRWTTEQRKAFANDLTHPQLLAVSASSNRPKGDQGPEAWEPPSRQIWYAYARAWTDVKTAYRLTATTDEKTALNQMLDTCITEAPR